MLILINSGKKIWRLIKLVFYKQQIYNFFRVYQKFNQVFFNQSIYGKNLYVYTPEGARDFFVRYFGAKPNAGYHNVQTGFRSFFLSFDDNVRLEVMTRPQMTDGEKERNRKGFIHLSFSVGSKEQVDTLTAQLKTDGFEVADGPRTTGDGYYESCIVGFEGNLIEITV